MTRLSLALTLVQPWASLLVAGVQDVVNLPWAIPHILPSGRWLAVHAGRCIAALTPAEECSIRQRWGECPESLNTLPRSALVGLVRIEGYGKATKVRGDDFGYCQCMANEHGNRCALRPSCSPWAFGPRCWLIDRAITLETPLPALGRPGVWPVPDEVVPTLRAKLGRMAA